MPIFSIFFFFFSISNLAFPGIGHSLQKYSTVLIRGCRVRDIPAIKYRVIRGEFDGKSVYERLTSRSKYGAKKREIFF
jgi:small subunit ribosomal protein S12